MGEQLQQVEVYDPFQTVQAVDEKNEKQRAIEKKRKQLQDGLDRLVERAADYSMTYGDEDIRTQFVAMFVDIGIQMKDVMEVIQSMNEALSFLGNAVDYIDMSINLVDGIFNTSLEHKYGFWSRLKMRRKRRKAIKNNAKRMRQVTENMNASIMMATSMAGSLQKSMFKMRENMARMNAKNQKALFKKNKKGDPNTAGLSLSKDALRLINEKKNERNGGGSAPGTSGDTSGSAPTPPQGPQGGSGGIDDIVF